MDNNKVVIIDDETIVNHKISEMLRFYGYSVSSASNGGDGLLLVKQERPHLIILDITIPVMNGLKILKAIRENDEIKDTKIIVLTNIISSRIIRHAAELGVQDYLIKGNHTYAEVIDRVKNYFYVSK